MVAVDEDHRIILFNEKAEKVFGYRSSEVLGKDLTQILPTQYSASHHAYVKTFARSDETARLMADRLEVFGRRKNGEEFPAEISISKARAGEKLVFTAVVRDVTGRKRTERLRAMQFELDRALLVGGSIEAVYRSVLDVVCRGLAFRGGAVWEIDRKTGLVHCVTTGHAGKERGEALLQAPTGTVVEAGSVVDRVWLEGQPVWVDTPMEDLTGLELEVARGYGEAVLLAFPVRIGEAPHAVIQLFGGVLQEPDDELLHVVGRIGKQLAQHLERRWTEEALVRSEEALRRSQKMEALGRLAGGVAHDLGNLVTIIHGYTDQLIGRLPQDTPLMQKARGIRRAAGRVMTLTQELLMFSRRQVKRPKVVDLNEVITESQPMLQRLIGDRITLVTNLIPRPAYSRIDPTQLDQVLMNLVTNARDAMPWDGRITIETAEVTLDDARAETVGGPPGPYVVLTVTDTGTGMIKAVQARIFEPFFTTKQRGTGLGLAVVYGIIKQNGGGIEVASTRGHGTSFRIYLPREEGTLEESSPEDSDMPSLHGSETVLLVEDEAEVRCLVRETLSDQGYQVLEAGNTDEAIEAIARHGGPVHLLVTDIVMPGKDGKELARLLRQNRPETKVLFISGSPGAISSLEELRKEGSSFLGKPFSGQMLIRKVRELLDQTPPTNSTSDQSSL
jgi:PAS domain S-box-containing protein